MADCRGTPRRPKRRLCRSRSEKKLYISDRSVTASLLDEDFKITIVAQQEKSLQPVPTPYFTARASISKTASKQKPKLTDVCSKRSRTSSSSNTKAKPAKAKKKNQQSRIKIKDQEKPKSQIIKSAPKTKSKTKHKTKSKSERKTCSKRPLCCFAGGE